MESEEPAKTKILAISRERFLASGFAHVSVEELVATLGISKKTFYKYFRGKEDLIAELVRRLKGEVKQKIETIIKSDSRFIEKISAVMTVLAVQVGSIDRTFQQDLQRVFPHLWQEIEEFRREMMSVNLTLLLEQGVREGAVRSNISIRVFLLSFLGAVERVVRPELLAHESFSMHQALHNILAIFFHGILTSEASRELDEYQYSQRTQPF
jgi:AcrR family transcriptional regulator